MPKRKSLQSFAKVFYLSLVIIEGIVIVAALLHGQNFAVLNPQGLIARQERRLIIFAVLLALTVVIPVYALTFGIVWRYRASNTKAAYRPDWDHNPVIETVWWLIPFILISILSVVTWQTSHSLNPFKPLKSSRQPLTIQVVALEWKWLFIYPAQHIASVNYVEFPEQTPINFEITADAPMNSFWIPQLGGQIYAMSGMSTNLHLIANGPGSYRGVSANISGRGFAGMKFVAHSSSDIDFEEWVFSVKDSRQALSLHQYNLLAHPSENNQPSYFSSVQSGLYNQIVVKYAHPALWQTVSQE
ncbi:ubiquinol oxidase subunit II [Candidatus Saccharibacteria bacterium]|nr:ubiquinol oxidase subunit II [Candidatus Saccharibacteria bacterium]